MKLQNFLSDLIVFSEFIAALFAVLNFKKVGNTYWKWFVFYLVFIFCAEFFSMFVLETYTNFKKYYYNYLIIPVEFIFLYWLYACKSLLNKQLFAACSIIYCFCLVLYVVVFDSFSSISSLNYIIGTLLLMILIVLEFKQQIKSDKIIFFKENMMFYINFGIILFYIGTLPFYAFNEVLYQKSGSIWIVYSNITLLSCSIMYFLFAASFIWGKPNT